MLDDDQKERLIRALAAAHELPAEQRPDFVAEVAGEDPAVGRELAELLQVDTVGLESFLAVPVMGEPARTRAELRSDAVVDDRDDEPIPDAVGPFRILSQIGSGGMGVVYLVEQSTPVNRRVALKVIRKGFDSRAVLKRFALERQALALMNHPNVAVVHDAGTTEQGQPYFVMEYVDGLPITDHCDQQQLDVRARIDLFRQVCEGVQHAHQKGVIHRDLKPGNVIVAKDGDRPTAKIIDFGIARATDEAAIEHSVLTEQGLLLGTPEYMSPEQARMDVSIVDARTDVYSLGVMLYELLTGALPFSSDELRRRGYIEIQRILQEVDPPKPSTRAASSGERQSTSAHSRGTSEVALVRSLRGDLDWIVMRAIAKDPERRYATPTALAEDLGRYLEFEPVLAGPPSAAYRARKWLRRYRVQAAAAAAVLLALVAGLVAALWQADRAVVAERTAERRADDLASEKVRVEFERDRADRENRRFRLVRYSIDLDDSQREFRALHPDPESWQRGWTALVPELERWLTERGDALVAAADEVEQALEAMSPQARSPDRAAAREGAVDRFLYATLEQFRDRMLEFGRELTGTLSNARYRLYWARVVEALSREHPRATTTWEAARAAITRADDVVASSRYAQVAIDLKPQQGLVPIGMNPRTKLWEFYHLRSAWSARDRWDPEQLPIPMHDPETGRVAVSDETGIVFVLIPGGTFTMGAQANDPQAPGYDRLAGDDETPHEVTLAPFFLARHELTQAQWLRLSLDGHDPSRYPAEFTTAILDAPVKATHPVESITWTVCRDLLAQHGLLLPTEAQWEYAARAGTTTSWSTGSEVIDLRGFANVLDERAQRDGPWTGEFAPFDDAFVIHAPVDNYRPNGWGLHGVHGNVTEWCRDRFADYGDNWRPGDGLRKDPREPIGARIARGGAFDVDARYSRSGQRFKFVPAYLNHNVGLRVARVLDAHK